MSFQVGEAGPIEPNAKDLNLWLIAGRAARPLPARPFWKTAVSQLEIEFQHVDPRLAEHAEDASIDMTRDQGRDPLCSDAACGGDARHLQRRIGRAYIRIKPRSRRGQHVGRELPAD